MKMIKKLAAVLLALLTLLSLAACHPKNEVAVTIGDYKFTSGYYMCALVFADIEAQDEAYNLAMSGEAKGIDITKEDYRFDVKIDGKKYETWVKDKAMDTLKTVAAYKTLCAKNKIKISKADKAGAEAIAQQEWNQYYATVLLENGVSEKTYTQFRVDDYYSELYFGHLYEKGGTKEVSEEEIKKYLNENYVLCNVIGEDLSQLEDKMKTEKKEKINGYYNDLVKGTKTFAEIYKTHNNIKDEQTNTSSTTSTSKEEKPKDEYASFVSKANGGDHFKSIMEMKTGEIKILNGEKDSDILLVVKKDVNEDPYYIKNADLEIRHALKDEEFEKEIAKFKKTLKVDEDTYATKRFKVKKIKYPETSTSY